MRPITARTLLAAIAVAALLALASALYSQHVRDMMPCAWCVLQRLIYLALAAAALLGLLLPGTAGRRIGAALALPLAGSGLAAALWQHFVANASASCNMTLADRIIGATGLDRSLPQVFAAYASCADAKVTLAGLPFEFWSAALFALLALAALRVLRRPA